MKVKLFEQYISENKIWTGKEVNDHIRSITPQESDVPDYFMDTVIVHRKFEKKSVDLNQLLITDSDFKEYYDSGEERYDEDSEDFIGYAPHPDEINNEIVIVDGELLDGYSRASQLLRMGENNTLAFVAIPKQVAEAFENFKTETIRLSCAALARIEIDGKFLFILNKNSVKVGKPSYGPLGGALEFSEVVRPFLEGLGASFEKGLDLRITIPTSNLQTYLDWFYTKTDREITSVREVYEELVLEEEIVKMEPSDIQETYIKTITEDKLSNRQGQEGVKTTAVYEVYEVVLSETVQQQILNYIETSTEQKVILVSKEEVPTDSRLGSHCKHIL